MISLAAIAKTFAVELVVEVVDGWKSKPAVRFAGACPRSCVDAVPASLERESALVGVGTLILLFSFGFKSSNFARATLGSCKVLPA